jgi:hypothetical protein
VPEKQIGAELGFQCLDPGRDVRRDAMQNLGGASDAAGVGNCLEHANLSQFHASPKVNG